MKQGGRQQQGFALAIAMGVGTVLIAIGTATLLLAGDNNHLSRQRQASLESLLTAESGVAIVLAALSRPNNSVLLTRNLDQLNPDSERTYLGTDGRLDTGDEKKAALNEWSSYVHTQQPCYPSMAWPAPDLQLTGPAGNGGQYTVLSYIYAPETQQATLLVKGEQNGNTSYVSVQLEIESDLNNFPGVLSHRAVLRGRAILGTRGNFYYDPDQSLDTSLAGASLRDAGDRTAHLDAIWSGAADDVYGDTVNGTLVACKLKLPTLPSASGTSLGSITGDRTLTSRSGQISHYRIRGITLGNGQRLAIDTTDGPVHLHIDGAVQLSENAQIRNIRTDGIPPRVGDLRLFVDAPSSQPITLLDKSCIQNAFLLSPRSGLELFTETAGCPGNSSTSLEGVVWVNTLTGSINGDSARRQGTEPPSIVETNAVTAGIAIPKELASLEDLFSDIEWPTYYQISEVKNWQRVSL